MKLLVEVHGSSVERVTVYSGGYHGIVRGVRWLIGNENNEVDSNPVHPLGEGRKVNTKRQ